MSAPVVASTPGAPVEQSGIALVISARDRMVETIKIAAAKNIFMWVAPRMIVFLKS